MIGNVTSSGSVANELVETKIGDLNLSTPKSSILRDEPLSLILKFKILGRLRETFTQRTWEDSYKADDRGFRVTYRIQFEKRVGKMLPVKIGEPIRLVRKGSFYWSRDPDILNRIWAMIIDENSTPHIPRSESEAQELIFDISRTIDLLGSDLGAGRHRISARVKANWGRHHFTQKDSVTGVSRPVQIECK